MEPNQKQQIISFIFITFVHAQAANDFEAVNIKKLNLKVRFYQI